MGIGNHSDANQLTSIPLPRTWFPVALIIFFSLAKKKEIRRGTGIPHRGFWRRGGIGLRDRFCRESRMGRGKSLRKRIFAVFF